MTRGKALTDRAAKLDTDITMLREKIEHAGPVRETNTQGKALARLFGADDAAAAELIARQNTAMMIVVELLIVALVLAAEEIEKHELPARASANSRAVARGEEQEEATPADIIEYEALDLPEELYPALEPAREAPRPLPAPRPVTDQSTESGPRLHAAARRAQKAAEGTPAPHPFTAPAKPRLVASEAVPFGSVVQIVRDLLEPGTARSKVGVVDLYKTYAATCTAAGKRAIAPAEFPAALAPICKACDIAVRDDGDAGIFLLKVKLKEPEQKVAEGD